MAVLTVEEITRRVLERFPESERESDDAIALIEDISDTINESNVSEELENLREENKELRQKYVDRFLKKIRKEDSETDESDKEEEKKEETIKVDDLWKEEV